MPSAEFLGKMHQFIRSLAESLVALAFFCCHYIFDLCISSLTLSFIVLINMVLIILAAFKSILSQSRCSFERNTFFTVPCSLKPLLGSQNNPLGGSSQK